MLRKRQMDKYETTLLIAGLDANLSQCFASLRSAERVDSRPEALTLTDRMRRSTLDDAGILGPDVLRLSIMRPEMFVLILTGNRTFVDSIPLKTMAGRCCGSID
jgi:hypothetical protein